MLRYALYRGADTAKITQFFQKSPKPLLNGCNSSSTMSLIVDSTSENEKRRHENSSDLEREVNEGYLDSLFQQQCLPQYVFEGGGPVFGTAGQGLREISRALYWHTYAFIAETCGVFSLNTSTNVLAMHMLDIVLSKYPFKKDHIPALGCTCVLLASKMEEVQVGGSYR